MRKTVKSACRRHRLLIIGDSHIRGLSEKINNCLDDCFSVLGITKPNADIETVTSPIHLKTGKLTKEDLIIFLGGTNDISRNEAKKGLCSLKDFTQRTINTNLILLYSITNANDCSENTLLTDSSNILTTNQKLSTEVPPKSKCKTKLLPQLKDLVPLTL
jgi:hypothetical protein